MKPSFLAIEKLIKNEPDPAFARRAKIIFENLDLGPGQKILDVGCGRGFYLQALSLLPFRFKLWGIDLNPNYLAVAQKNLSRKANLLKADATTLPFEDNFFDRVVASEILEHISKDQQALKEIYRVLKPKGVTLVTVPNQNYPFFWDPLNYLLEKLFKRHIRADIWWLAGLWADHQRLYLYYQLARKVKKAGFKIEKSWHATRFCLPFSHFLLYGLGKNLVEKGLLKTFNRFDSTSGRSPFHHLLLLPLRLVDRLNRQNTSFSSVNIILKLRK